MGRQQTALEQKLEGLASQIGQVGLAASLVALAAMAAQFTYEVIVVRGQPWQWEFLSEYLKFVITSITILVCPAWLASSLIRNTALCTFKSPVPVMQGSSAAACHSGTQQYAKSCQALSAFLGLRMLSSGGSNDLPSHASGD